MVFGNVLKRMGDADKRIIGVDADVKNSTFSQKLKDAHPDQFIDCFIAE
jgi:transketolase